MDTKDRKLQEQQAPDKNTDNAFVKVGSDGRPEIPQEARNSDDQEQSADSHYQNSHPKK